MMTITSAHTLTFDEQVNELAIEWLRNEIANHDCKIDGTHGCDCMSYREELGRLLWKQDFGKIFNELKN